VAGMGGGLTDGFGEWEDDLLVIKREKLRRLESDKWVGTRLYLDLDPVVSQWEPKY